MSTLTFDRLPPTRSFEPRGTMRTTMHTLRRRMPTPIAAPDFDGLTLRLFAFAAALVPSAALSWMFVAS